MTAQTFLTKVQQVVDAVLDKDGTSSTTLRQTVMDYATALGSSQEPSAKPPDGWQPYVDTLIKHAYRLSDMDLEQLKARGRNEDEIFELTISAALGSGLARLKQGIAAIENANGGRA